MLMCSCGSSNDINRSKKMSKIEAFLTYPKYEDRVIEQIAVALNEDDEEKINRLLSDDVIDGNETSLTCEDFISFIEGNIISIDRKGESLAKANGGLFGKRYSIDFYGTYDVKTDVNEYYIFYHYSFCNNNKDVVGLRSLGAFIVGDYEDSGYMYYDIPGVFVCTNENKDTILELKKKYGAYSK